MQQWCNWDLGVKNDQAPAIDAWYDYSKMEIFSWFQQRYNWWDGKVGDKVGSNPSKKVFDIIIEIESNANMWYIETTGVGYSSHTNVNNIYESLVKKCLVWFALDWIGLV